MNLSPKIGSFFTLMVMSAVFLTACGPSNDETNTPDETVTIDAPENIEESSPVFSEDDQKNSKALTDEFIIALTNLERNILESKTCTDEDVSGILAPFEDPNLGPKLIPIIKNLEYQFTPEGSDEEHYLYQATYFGPIAEALFLDPAEQNEADFQTIVFQVGVNVSNEPCVEHFI